MAITDKTMSDKDWAARDDAHTLGRAKEIMADEKRLAAAVKAAKDIADELAKETEHMGGVAKGDLAGKMYPKMQGAGSREHEVNDEARSGEQKA